MSKRKYNEISNEIIEPQIINDTNSINITLSVERNQNSYINIYSYETYLKIDLLAIQNDSNKNN